MSRLERADLARNTASESLAALGFAGLEALCREVSAPYTPEPVHGQEPRDGFPIVYSESRRRRMAIPEDICVVCEQQTCPAVDLAQLPGDELAFLTPNLYPITYPFEDPAATTHGLHLVHWSCLDHRGGLAGADPETAAGILRQLSRAEEFLLHNAPERYPERGDGHRGHVGVVKNRGRRVGGSVEHDHQQILLSAVLPAEPERARGLGTTLLRDTPKALVVDDLDGAARVLVPPFMRRPLHAFVVPAGPEAGWLHHLDDELLDALALALARLTRAADTLMTASHGEPAWNIVCHTGPGIGPLFELRPFTQPLGGYEHLGLYLCEERPETSAARLREAFAAPPSSFDHDRYSDHARPRT